MKQAVTLLHALDQKWQPVEGIPGAYFVSLNEDSETGACTWAIKQDAGATFPEHEHPHWTEQIVLQGAMTGPEGTYNAGSYQCLPPNVKHGPYKIGPEGMIGLLISQGPIW